MTMEIREGRGVLGLRKDHIFICICLDRLPSDLLAGGTFAGHRASVKQAAALQQAGNNDVTKEPIPVLPTVHYKVGGIPTNYYCEVIPSIRSEKTLTWNTAMVKTSELQNSLGCAATTLYSAEVRKVPRGARAHENLPGRDGEDWMKHTLVAYFDKDEGTMEINIR